MLPPAHEVVPHHVALLELEPPMRLAPFGFEPRTIRRAELQRRAVIDRRLAAGELALALEFELIRRLVGGIKPPARFQLLPRLRVAVEAVRLAHLVRPIDAEPVKVLL